MKQEVVKVETANTSLTITTKAAGASFAALVGPEGLKLGGEISDPQIAACVTQCVPLTGVCAKICGSAGEGIGAGLQVNDEGVAAYTEEAEVKEYINVSRDPQLAEEDKLEAGYWFSNGFLHWVGLVSQ
jgi:hypothetical protein